MSNVDKGIASAFLYKAIDDTQGTIRSIDTKAGVGVVVLGAMVGKMLDHEQLAAVKGDGTVAVMLGVVFSILATISALLAFKTVFPMVNPAENVALPDNLQPSFFVSKLSPRRFWRFFSSSKRFARLSETHASFCKAIQDASPELLERVLAAEVLKLAFIRQMKIDRLTAFAKVLMLTVVAFIAVVVWLPKRPSSPAGGAGCIGGTSVELGVQRGSTHVAASVDSRGME